MTITLPALSTLFASLTPVQVGTLAVLLAIVDLAWNVIRAIAAHAFDPAKVALFIEDHVLVRVFPILALAILGAGAFGLPAFPPLFAASLVGLAAYAVETLGSLGLIPTPAAPGG